VNCIIININSVIKALLMSKLFFCSNFKFLNFSIIVLLKASIVPWPLGLYAAPLTNLIF